MTDIIPQSQPQITAAREHVFTQIQHALNAAWQFTGSLPEGLQADAQNALRVAWENTQIMNEQWAETQELMKRSLALVQGHELVLAEASHQRDTVITEFKELVDAIKTRDLNHPMIMNLYTQLYNSMYENVMEQHNEAFWESLPYDIADIMGEEWSHTEASTLYELIANPELDDEGIAEEFGTTPEAVREARAKLLAVIREFDQSRDD